MDTEMGNKLEREARFLHIAIPYDKDDGLITFDDGLMTELECDEEFVPPMLNAEDQLLEFLIDLKERKTVGWNYEGDYQCSQNEVRRMFADADISQPADSRILKNYSWDDIDIPSLEQYRRLFAMAKPNHPWLALDNLDLMKKLGGYRKNRETGEEGFTLAGLLMFGKYDSIRDVSCVPRFFPDFRNIPMDTTQTRWLDRVCPDGMWEANLFQFYRRVLPKLQEVIPVPFKLEGNQRRDDTPAHEALREAQGQSLCTC